MRFLLATLLILTPITSAANSNPDWSLYDQLLADHVQKGIVDGIAINQVNYTAIQSDNRFQKIIKMIADFPAKKLQNQNDKLSFYINAYNIMAINVVISQQPSQSIKDAGSWFKPVWNIKAGYLHGEATTLAEIEHDILRLLGEPRIHFAIVCASVSCPDLRPEAYHATRIEEQLQEQTRDFLLNSDKGVKIIDNKVHYSKIFSWFSKDFGGKDGVISFIQQYKELPENPIISKNLPYNWNLNSSKHSEAN